ncbi:MAG: hypothetical protein IJL17_13110 [Kiritimatiellae bacterium]|nr:hypothetical protein [Kiritimatiellia bacterium]
MKTTKTRTIFALALCATGFLGSVQAKDTRVFWLIDGQQTAIHRFNVTNAGEADETWTETEPLVTSSTSMKVYNVLPAHGGYYLCFYDGRVARYTLDGSFVRNVGTLSGCTSFEISGDQAYIYGSDMNSGAGHNKISALHLGTGSVAVFVTNGISRVRCLAWGSDGLLYACGRNNGEQVDYWGNTIPQYAGVQAIDVSNGKGAVVKHWYRTDGSTGGCAVDAARNHVYCFSGNTAHVFGRSEYGLDGEITDFVRAWPTVVLNNPFSGAMIAGNPYTAEWMSGRGNVYRFDATNGATLVASIASSDVADSSTIGQAHALREDVFPEDDTTEAITKLLDYWSFNAATNPVNLEATFYSRVNPVRTARLTTGFTAAVRGAVREGLWCAAGANGRLASAILVPQTNNATIAFFVGFPQGFSGGQTLLRNPKMTVSVTAEGRLSVAMPNGKDIAGNTTTGAGVAGTTSLADGQWHHVAVVRRDYRFEVWVDGVKEGESDPTTVAAYDDLNTQWYLLDSSNANAMMFDELRFYNAALARNDIRLLQSLATDGLKVPRDPTVRSDAAAAAIGTVVAHANPDDHAWGVPAVIADPGNGTLYMAADFAREKGENNQSVYWKSTDHGETWTRTGSDASMGALALFRFDTDPSGTFRAAGIEPDRNVAWGGTTTDGCARWGTFRQQSATPLPSKWYPTFAVPGYARNLAVAGGIYTLDVVTAWRGALRTLSTGASNNWSVAALRPGGVAYFGGQATAFYAASVTNHVNATNATPVESMVVGRRESETGAVSYRGAVSIRGASRPFGVVRDETTGWLWAVTTYAKDSATPWAQANRLALYCATNALHWTWCGDIAVAGTPETFGFSNPNVAIVGDDLVAVFGASVNDTTGADAPRDVNASNYILSKRIPNFRSRVPAQKPAGRYLLVGDNSAQRILRLRENEETGEWEPDGYFADGTYTDAKYGMFAGDDITYANGKVWILINGRIFAFNTDGTFTGTYFDLTLDRELVPSNPNVMGFSYDGRYIYSTTGLVSAPTDSRMYRTDVTTGVTTLFCTSSDSEALGTHLRRLRGIAGLPDGRVAVCNRDAGELLALNPDGSFGEVVWSGAVGAIQTLYLDRRAKKLYASGFSWNLCCWDLVTGAKKAIGGRADVIGITGDDRGRVFGTVYDKPASLIDMLADGGALTQSGHRLILNGGNSFQRLCFFDTTPPSGTILIFR